MRRNPLAVWSLRAGMLSMACVAAPGCVRQGSASEGGHAPFPAIQIPEDIGSDRARVRFAVETGLGAHCTRYSGSASTWHFDDFRARVSCHGKPPSHVVDAVARLPGTHPGLTSALREHLRTGVFEYLAVPGLGRRADFIVLFDDADGLWVRTFEGPDPDTTVFMVFGPAGDGDSALRGFRIYRAVAGGIPEEVTDVLAPKKPALDPEEAMRYGRLVDPEVEGLRATDNDIVIDARPSIYRPVLAWTLEQTEAGYELLDDSERRFDGSRLHFGFLAWNGRRFELLDRMPYSKVACLDYAIVSEQNEAVRACEVDESPNSNRFLEEDRK